MRLPPLSTSTSETAGPAPGVVDDQLIVSSGDTSGSECPPPRRLRYSQRCGDAGRACGRLEGRQLLGNHRAAGQNPDHRREAGTERHPLGRVGDDDGLRRHVQLPRAQRDDTGQLCLERDPRRGGAEIGDRDRILYSGLGVAVRERPRRRPARHPQRGRDPLSPVGCVVDLRALGHDPAGAHFDVRRERRAPIELVVDGDGHPRATGDDQALQRSGRLGAGIAHEADVDDGIVGKGVEEREEQLLALPRAPGGEVPRRRGFTRARPGGDLGTGPQLVLHHDRPAVGLHDHTRLGGHEQIGDVHPHLRVRLDLHRSAHHRWPCAADHLHVGRRRARAEVGDDDGLVSTPAGIRRALGAVPRSRDRAHRRNRRNTGERRMSHATGTRVARALVENQGEQHQQDDRKQQRPSSADGVSPFDDRVARRICSRHAGTSAVARRAPRRLRRQSTTKPAHKSTCTRIASARCH